MNGVFLSKDIIIFLNFYHPFKNNKQGESWLAITCDCLKNTKFLAIIVSINATFISINYQKMYVNTRAKWFIMKLHIEKLNMLLLLETLKLKKEYSSRDTMNIKIVGAKFYQRMIYFSLFIKLFVIQYKTKNKP